SGRERTEHTSRAATILTPIPVRERSIVRRQRRRIWRLRHPSGPATDAPRPRGSDLWGAGAPLRDDHSLWPSQGDLSLARNLVAALRRTGKPPEHDRVTGCERRLLRTVFVRDPRGRAHMHA